LTNIPGTVTPKRMGRPPLSKKSDTVETKVRMTIEVRERIEALVGPNRMAVFIREAIERELKRRERKG
jgi:hypothetical protein